MAQNEEYGQFLSKKLARNRDAQIKASKTLSDNAHGDEALFAPLFRELQKLSKEQADIYGCMAEIYE